MVGGHVLSLLALALQLPTSTTLLFPASTFRGVLTPERRSNSFRSRSNAEHLRALAQTPGAGWNCTCSNQQFCRPLATTSAVADKEVMAVWGTVPEKYRPLTDIDWNTTTTLLLGAWPGSSIWSHETMNATELLCLAHSRGVRVVLAAPYSNWWPGASASHYTKPDHINASTINWMAQATLDVVYAHGFDGTNFDIEGGYTAAYESEVTSLVSTVSSHFKAALPNCQISFWLGLSAEQRPAAFNLPALAAAVDVMAVCAYDLISNASTIGGPELTLPFLSSSVEQLMDGGVAARKIVVGFGWRATGYTCKETDPNTETCTCAETQVYKGRTVCTNERHGYFWGLAQLAKSATPTRGLLRWSEAKQASYFNVGPNASCPKPVASNPACPWGWNAPSFNASNDNKWTMVRQVWLDGPSTLAPRYEWARSRGLRGVTITPRDCGPQEPFLGPKKYSIISIENISWAQIIFLRVRR
jgi:hypothetical protein